MKIAMIATVSAAALALAACGGSTTNTADTGTNTAMTGTADDTMMTNDATMATPAMSAGQTFANAAAASDAFEIASSRQALATSTSPAIKKFAQQMIDAHTDSTAKLKAAVAGVTPAITPDPTLTAEQQSKIDSMKALTGKDFDTAYVAAQTEGHQKTLDTLRAYAASGDVPELKAFATTLTPIVTGHLNMAKSLKA